MLETSLACIISSSVDSLWDIFLFGELYSHSMCHVSLGISIFNHNLMVGNCGFTYQMLFLLLVLFIHFPVVFFLSLNINKDKVH